MVFFLPYQFTYNDQSATICSTCSCCPWRWLAQAAASTFLMPRPIGQMQVGEGPGRRQWRHTSCDRTVAALVPRIGGGWRRGLWFRGDGPKIMWFLFDIRLHYLAFFLFHFSFEILGVISHLKSDYFYSYSASLNSFVSILFFSLLSFFSQFSLKKIICVYLFSSTLPSPQFGLKSEYPQHVGLTQLV